MKRSMVAQSIACFLFTMASLAGTVSENRTPEKEPVSCQQKTIEYIQGSTHGYNPASLVKQGIRGK